MFASKVKRAPSATGKKPLARAARPITSSSLRRKADVEFEESDSEERDSVPGPGYYHKEQIHSSFNVGTSNKEFQFFGSGVARFQEGGKSLLGPGYYEVGGASKNVSVRKTILPFRKNRGPLSQLLFLRKTIDSWILRRSSLLPALDLTR